MSFTLHESTGASDDEMESVVADEAGGDKNREKGDSENNLVLYYFIPPTSLGL